MTSLSPEPALLAEEHVEISQRFIRQAEVELEQGDILQASEKAWGAAAHAVKAIAQQRGWNHHRHDLLSAVTEQTAAEWDSPQLNVLFASAQTLHRNFYEGFNGEGSVRAGINSVRDDLLPQLERVRQSPPRNFVIQTAADITRWRKLAGETKGLGEATL